MTVSWLSNVCFGTLTNLTQIKLSLLLRQTQWKRAICLQEIWFTETIVSNSSVKTVLQYQFLLDSRRQNTTTRNEIIKFST